MVLDMFNTFIEPLETEFGIKSNHRIGRFSDVSQEPGVHRPDRGDQLRARPRRRPVDREPGAGRRDPGRRQPQRQDADLAVPGDAARHQGGQLPADPRGLRARQLPSALAPYHKPRCFGLTIDPERLREIRNERRPEQQVRVARELPLRSARGRGDDAARRHPLAVVDAQVDRGDRDHDPARHPADRLEYERVSANARSRGAVAVARRPAQADTRGGRSASRHWCTRWPDPNPGRQWHNNDSRATANPPQACKSSSTCRASSGTETHRHNQYFLHYRILKHWGFGGWPRRNTRNRSAR